MLCTMIPKTRAEQLKSWLLLARSSICERSKNVTIEDGDGADVFCCGCISEGI